MGGAAAAGDSDSKQENSADSAGGATAPGAGEEEAGVKILSLGAGVQSSTMALMAEHGELETPDCAIFADTGWEPLPEYIYTNYCVFLCLYPTTQPHTNDT